MSGPAPHNASSGKEKLILAAIRLFGRRGFEGTTVRDLGEEAGMSFASVRGQFGSKEGLLEAVEKRVMDSYLDLITQAMAERSSEGMVELIDHMDDNGALSLSDVTCFLRRAIVEDRPIARKLVKAMLDQAQDRTLPMFADLQDKFPRERILKDPVLSLQGRIGRLILAPYLEDLLGRDVFSADELKRRTLDETRIWMLVGLGLQAEREQASKA
jgi:TetR/AcrR family transcriptional regulator, regulator of cefoperazone and chloramphenicol sensitivity